MSLNLCDLSSVCVCVSHDGSMGRTGKFTYMNYEWLIFAVNVGKCIPYMDAMGVCVCVFVGRLRCDGMGWIFFFRGVCG